MEVNVYPGIDLPLSFVHDTVMLTPSALL
ncbi:MAG: YceK/YidQ family lipoprotein [Saprospiraceae bacterium]|nr:YceK/YidQ family lipoprotein [Saprospiraceae bacterium]